MKSPGLFGILPGALQFVAKKIRDLIDSDALMLSPDGSYGEFGLRLQSVLHMAAAPDP